MEENIKYCRSLLKDIKCVITNVRKLVVNSTHDCIKILRKNEDANLKEKLRYYYSIMDLLDDWEYSYDKYLNKIDRVILHNNVKELIVLNDYILSDFIDISYNIKNIINMII